MKKIETVSSCRGNRKQGKCRCFLFLLEILSYVYYLSLMYIICYWQTLIWTLC